MLPSPGPEGSIVVRSTDCFAACLEMGGLQRFYSWQLVNACDQLPITINGTAECSPLCWTAWAKLAGVPLALLNHSPLPKQILPYIVIKADLRSKPLRGRCRVCEARGCSVQAAHIVAGGMAARRTVCCTGRFATSSARGRTAGRMWCHWGLGWSKTCLDIE